MRAVILSVAFLAPLAAAAAAPADPSVSGRITLDGKPLAGGTLTFHPADPKGKPVATAVKDGVYEVKAIPAGEYKLTVEYSIDRPDPKDPKGKGKVNVIPSKYSDPKLSVLTAKVARGETVLDLDLASR